MTPIPPRHSAPPAARLALQQGFSLLESVIALLIFSAGIMGLIGLQTAATATQTETRSRTEAASLAQEMMALMWTDIDQLEQYAISTDGRCTATACQRWLNKVRAVLPNSNAHATHATIQDLANNTIGTDVDLTLTWQMPNGDQRRYDTSTSIVKATVP